MHASCLLVPNNAFGSTERNGTEIGTTENDFGILQLSLLTNAFKTLDDLQKKYDEDSDSILLECLNETTFVGSA